LFAIASNNTKTKVLVSAIVFVSKDENLAKLMRYLESRLSSRPPKSGGSLEQNQAADQASESIVRTVARVDLLIQSHPQQAEIWRHSFCRMRR
jgi:hypothetical protein